jgi:hypothetical protein
LSAESLQLHSLKPREEGKTSTTTLDEMLLSSRRFSDELPLSTNLVYLTPPARSGLWWSKLTHTATPFEILLEEASCSASTLASFPLLPPTFQSQPKLASFLFLQTTSTSIPITETSSQHNTFNMQNFGAPAPPMTGRACYNCTFSSLWALSTPLCAMICPIDTCQQRLALRC